MNSLKNLVVKYMHETADRIDVGTSEISESQAMDILRVVAHEALSKEQACRHLNLSKSRFDDHVRGKDFPKGRKRTGHRELDWFKDELDIAAIKLKKKNEVKKSKACCSKGRRYKES